MEKSKYHKIYKYLQEKLETDRYIHTMGVAYTATSLAIRWDCPIESAQIAGLLHDCAKNIPDDKKISLCEKHNIPMTDMEKAHPYLLHCKLGAFIAQSKFDIEDEEILNAIAYHTTGRPEMTLLDKIIYIADYIEPNRRKAANLALVRKLAFENIDEALFVIMRDILDYLHQSDSVIDETTQQAFDYYKARRVEDES